VRFLCEFLCAFCANFCVLFVRIFVRIFVWVHKGNAYGVRRPFAGATFLGGHLWNIQLLCWDWSEHAKWGGRSNTLFGAACRVPKTDALWGATLSKKLAIFLPILFQTSEILQVLFYKIEILFLAYRRWGIKHLQVT
jgi:hypothetical protein